MHPQSMLLVLQKDIKIQRVSIVTGYNYFYVFH